MKENKYDDSAFFEKYSQIPRSIKGIEVAGEWHTLKSMLPDFKCMLRHGFSTTGLREPTPSEEMMKTVPGMTDELRRPRILIISARKY